MHESIGREEHPASAKLNDSSKDGADDAPTIEYTSFGGPARNTAKSRAEQMAAERRVRITRKKLLFFSIEKKHFKLNSCSPRGLFILFFQLRQIAASQRRRSGTDSNEAVEDRPKVYIFFRSDPRILKSFVSSFPGMVARDSRRTSPTRAEEYEAIYFLRGDHPFD